MTQDRYVVAIASAMSERAAAMTGEITQTLLDEIPELRGVNRTSELLAASVEGNVDTILHSLNHDIAVSRITAPTAALEYARRLAQQGTPVNALVRAYRLGHRNMTLFVFDKVATSDVPPNERMAVLEEIFTRISDYIDWISQQVVSVYEQEREHWLDNQSSLRALRVRELLSSSKPVDVDAAATTIRYPLRWDHVALVVWVTSDGHANDELQYLQRFARELDDAMDADAPPLFAAADRLSAWVWLPFRSEPQDIVRRIREYSRSRSSELNVAIGTSGVGLDGFRKSHREAVGAHAVAVARGGPHTIIAASDVGVSAAALLANNLPETGRWVRRVLGPLSTAGENDARLRETLRVFLLTGGSHKAAAAELNLHYNTVKYRVARAEERRGRPIAADRVEVELALLLCHWYEHAVVQ